MPIKIPNDLPAAKALIAENIFVMDDRSASRQDVRPMKIAIVNLMPTKEATETQLLRLIGNTALQVDIDLIHTVSHTSKNTSPAHLLAFYKNFADIRDTCYDGMIVTGAPVEHIPFEEVDYWRELCGIMEWSTNNVYSTFYICWGAQAGLYYHYGVNKYPLEKKLTGVFLHYSPMPQHPLMRGFDDVFYVPHSRYTTVRVEDIAAEPDLHLLSVSDAAGVHIVADSACRKFFVTGHSEYERLTLTGEYFRDRHQGIHTTMPVGYFPQNNPWLAPVVNWRAHANLLFSNWMNYIVYQHMPYDLSVLKQE